MNISVHISFPLITFIFPFSLYDFVASSSTVRHSTVIATFELSLDYLKLQFKFLWQTQIFLFPTASRLIVQAKPTQPSVLYELSASFLGDKSGLGVKLTTHLHFVLRLKVHGATPPLPHTFYWRDA
jgi:hypothetical protein